MSNKLSKFDHRVAGNRVILVLEMSEPIINGEQPNIEFRVTPRGEDKDDNPVYQFFPVVLPRKVRERLFGEERKNKYDLHRNWDNMPIDRKWETLRLYLQRNVATVDLTKFEEMIHYLDAGCVIDEYGNFPPAERE